MQPDVIVRSFFLVLAIVQFLTAVLIVVWIMDSRNWRGEEFLRDIDYYRRDA